MIEGMGGSVDLYLQSLHCLCGTFLDLMRGCMNTKRIMYQVIFLYNIRWQQFPELLGRLGAMTRTYDP